MSEYLRPFKNTPVIIWDFVGTAEILDSWVFEEDTKKEGGILKKTPAELRFKLKRSTEAWFG